MLNIPFTNFRCYAYQPIKNIVLIPRSLPRSAIVKLIVCYRFTIKIKIFDAIRELLSYTFRGILVEYQVNGSVY